MEDGRSHADRDRGLLVITGNAERRILEMIDRLEHAEEHQPDAHAGREQHREPAAIGVVGARVGTTQPDPAQRRDDQVQAEQHEDVGNAHE